MDDEDCLTLVDHINHEQDEQNHEDEDSLIAEVCILFREAILLRQKKRSKLLFTIKKKNDIFI